MQRIKRLCESDSLQRSDTEAIGHAAANFIGGVYNRKSGCQDAGGGWQEAKGRGRKAWKGGCLGRGLLLTIERGDFQTVLYLR